LKGASKDARRTFSVVSEVDYFEAMVTKYIAAIHISR
jgi:hypothetical protein